MPAQAQAQARARAWAWVRVRVRVRDWEGSMPARRWRRPAGRCRAGPGSGSGLGLGSGSLPGLVLFESGMGIRIRTNPLQDCWNTNSCDFQQL